MPTPLTQKQLADVKRLLDQGKKYADVAKLLGISEGAVFKHSEGRNTILNSPQIDEIRRRYQQGEGRQALAEEFACSAETIRKYTKEIVRQPEPPAITNAQIAEIKRRLLLGDLPRTVSREMGIVHHIVRDMSLRLTVDYVLPDDVRAAVIRDKEAGKNLVQISHQHRLPYGLVNKVIGDATGARRGLVTVDETIKQKVLEEIKAGEFIRTAAKNHGVSNSCATQWVKAAVAAGEMKKPQPNRAIADDHDYLWMTELDPELEEWRVLLTDYISIKRPSQNSIYEMARLFFVRYLIDQDLPTKPSEFLVRGSAFPSFTSFMIGSRVRTTIASTLWHFVEWILDSEGFADHLDAEPIRLTEIYRNPIDRTVASEDQSRPRESNKIVMPYLLVSDLRKRIVQGPTFSDWTWVRGLSGRETVTGQQNARDWFPVTEDQLDKGDPDCVWRLRERVLNEPVLEMWSPVRWVHALFHLQTPCRSGQARMVDSGEADTFIYQNGSFVPNPNQKLRLGTVRSPHRQGVLRKPSLAEEASGVEATIYFNTNKTGDIGKSGKEKGHECPWPKLPDIAEDPYYWLERLRNWQMKYNPITKLIKWRDLRGNAKLSKKSVEESDKYPDTAFLFRAPEHKETPHWPISVAEADATWQTLIAAFEAVLDDEGMRNPSGTKIVLIDPETARAWSSPHSTRVSLITHFVLDGNVSPAVMMKVVGHARFIMLLYYTKVGLSHTQSILRTAGQLIEQKKYETFERDLSSADEERLRATVVFNAEDWKTVLPFNPADRNPLGWWHMHDGICLAGGVTHGPPSVPGCHNGALPVREFKGKDGGAPKHNPVPGGHRNCARCRWKACGKQHLLGLNATFNNRVFHMFNAKQDAIAGERMRNELLRQKARLEARNEPFQDQAGLINAERAMERATSKFAELALDVASLHRTIERVMALPDASGESMALISMGDLVTINKVVVDTESELLQLAQINADLELYPDDLDAGTAIYRYAQLIDAALERDGHQLIMARLSEKEKLAAANAIMRELEKVAVPDNYILGRHKVVEIMDRGDSLENVLGLSLKNVINLALQSQKPVSVRLTKKGVPNYENAVSAS